MRLNTHSKGTSSIFNKNCGDIHQQTPHELHARTSPNIFPNGSLHPVYGPLHSPVTKAGRPWSNSFLSTFPVLLHICRHPGTMQQLNRTIINTVQFLTNPQHAHIHLQSINGMVS